MSVPVRSIRLQRRSTKSLNTLSGASGEIFFDEENGTLRLYTANQSGSTILASRTWVEENTFSGDYNDLTNKPSLLSDINQFSDIDGLLFSGDYEDLANKPDLASLVPDITTINSIGDVNITGYPEQGQLLTWDGSIWTNSTVSGFQDTNTTYTLTGDAIAGGAQALLTDSDAIENALEFIAGTGISVTLTAANQITIANTDTNAIAVSDLTDISISNPQDGQTLVYSSGQWLNGSGGASGIQLTDLSVSVATEGTANLEYDNTSGLFTFTPPDLTSFAALDAFSVTTDAASSGGSLSYNNATGEFTFRPANLSGVSTLTSFSVTSNPANGGGSLSYNSTSGVFTFEPADLSNLSTAVVDDTAPQLGGDLDLNNNNITGVGDIVINTDKFTVAATTGNTVVAGTLDVGGVVSAASYSSSATGAPQITSASTITLTAPDGIITEGLVLSGVASPNSGTVNQQVMDCDCTTDTLFIFSNNTFGADYSVNFTNIPSLNEQFFRATVLDFSATGFGPTEVRIDGTAITSVYPGGTGGVTFTGPNKTEFMIYRSGGTYVAFGTVTENYST